MPETRSQAMARAARLGFLRSNVVQAKTGGYFSAPHGVTMTKAKYAYTDCGPYGSTARPSPAVPRCNR